MTRKDFDLSNINDWFIYKILCKEWESKKGVSKKYEIQKKMEDVIKTYKLQSKEVIEKLEQEEKYAPYEKEKKLKKHEENMKKTIKSETKQVIQEIESKYKKKINHASVWDCMKRLSLNNWLDKKILIKERLEHVKNKKRRTRKCHRIEGFKANLNPFFDFIRQNRDVFFTKDEKDFLVGSLENDTKFSKKLSYCKTFSEAFICFEKSLQEILHMSIQFSKEGFQAIKYDASYAMSEPDYFWKIRLDLEKKDKFSYDKYLKGNYFKWFNAFVLPYTVLIKLCVTFFNINFSRELIYEIVVINLTTKLIFNYPQLVNEIYKKVLNKLGKYLVKYLDLDEKLLFNPEMIEYSRWCVKNGRSWPGKEEWLDSIKGKEIKVPFNGVYYSSIGFSYTNRPSGEIVKDD